MKLEQPSPRRPGAGRRKRTSAAIPPLPMEWMDPMSWRLPSGKALAEFALQAGFLAPLIMGGPRVKRKRPAEAGPDVVSGAIKKEAPERTSSFRGGTR